MFSLLEQKLAKTARICYNSNIVRKQKQNNDYIKPMRIAVATTPKVRWTGITKARAEYPYTNLSNSGRGFPAQHSS